MTILKPIFEDDNTPWSAAANQVDDLWTEIEEIIDEVSIPYQQAGELSVSDLMVHYGIKHNQARGWMNKLVMQGWKSKYVRNSSNHIIKVVYKP